MLDFLKNRGRGWTEALRGNSRGIARALQLRSFTFKPRLGHHHIFVTGLMPELPMSTQPSSDPPTTEPAGEGHDTGSALWFWPGAIAVAAGLAIAAAHAPARIRLLGVFSVIFGLILGRMLVHLAATLHQRLNIPQVAWVGVVTAAGLIGSVCHLVALQPTPAPPTLSHPVATILAARMQEENGIQPGDTIPEFQPVVYKPPTFGIRVQTYLTSRVQNLGTWPSPWPELFWGVEVLAGTAAAIGMAWAMRSKEITP